MQTGRPIQKGIAESMVAHGVIGLFQKIQTLHECCFIILVELVLMCSYKLAKLKNLVLSKKVVDVIIFTEAMLTRDHHRLHPLKIEWINGFTPKESAELLTLK